MTEKELLYVEDAIEHEKNIAVWIQDTITKISDKKIQSTLEQQLKTHQKQEKDLKKCLEGYENE